LTPPAEITDLAEQIALRIEGIMLPDRWLKIKRAVSYSGIGRDRLKRLADDGDIVGFPDPDSGRGDWIFDRKSLDEYRMNQYRQGELEITG